LYSRSDVFKGFDIADLHRVEPLIMFSFDSRPVNLYFHQDMSLLSRGAQSDMRWRYAPGLYFGMERLLVNRASSCFCVSDKGTQVLRERFPALAENINFVSTWVDPGVFALPSVVERERLRSELRNRLKVEPSTTVLGTVGRIDYQKNPILLLEAFALFLARHANSVLVYIGDGALRAKVEEYAKKLGVSNSVRFLGICPQRELARILPGVDVFALTSRYEGMPIALLEALACGVPAVSTDVGEARRVVSDLSGRLLSDSSPAAVASALDEVFRANIAPSRCADAVRQFTPANTLSAVFENYRRLAQIAG
jgi:glycosyltransferase involved in cell wall biosynthesis